MEYYADKGTVFTSGGKIIMTNIYQNIYGNVNGTANAAGGNIQSTNYTISTENEKINKILKEIRDKLSELELSEEELESVNDDIEVLQEQVNAKEKKGARIKKAIDNIAGVVNAIPYKKEICDFIVEHLVSVREFFG